MNPTADNSPPPSDQIFPVGGLWLLIIALWAGAYLTHLGDRGLRLEEGRRAEPARAMLGSANWGLPQLYGEPYLSKPPLYFWFVALTAMGINAHHVDEWAVRLPAALAALGGAVVVGCFAARQISAATRALAALMTLAGPIMLDKGTLGEIETVFCWLIVSAWTVWYAGWRAMGDALPPPTNDTHGAGATPTIPMPYWLWTGVLLGLAMLTKGPPTLALFYVPVVTFLIVQRRPGLLLSFGHAFALALLIAPLAVWVAGVLQTANVSPDQAWIWWRRQLGAEGYNTPDGFWTHTWAFPRDVMIMLLPWNLLGAVVLWPALARRVGIPDDLRCYLAALILASFVFFWWWPTTRARHMMAVWYPVALTAALAAAHLPRLGPIGRWPEVCRAGAWIAAAATAAVGPVAWGLNMALRPQGAPAAAVGAALAILLAGLMVAVIRHTPRLLALPLVATHSALAIMAGWAVIHGLFFAPWRGPHDTSRRLYTQLADTLPPTQLVGRYTFLTFPYRGEGHYNSQFYFGPGLVALRNWTDLPPQRTCLVICQAGDVIAARQRGGIHIRILNPGPPELADVLVVEAVRSP